MVDDATAFLRAAMPLCATYGVRAVTLEPSSWRSTWAPDRLTSGGILHGGAVMALADSAGAYCAFANLPEGATATATIESKTNRLRAVRSGTIRATSRVLHAGGTTIVVETEMRDEQDRLVAKTTRTQAVLRK
ncbi:MAG TPA: PaaI family thioesterase [Acidimicrobiia bacterium]